MSSRWEVTGNISKIKESKGNYIITIADNIYKNINGRWTKVDTIWFTCMSKFKPKAKVGSTVIAVGHYVNSESKNNSHMMQVDHMGVIKEGEMKPC